MNKSEGSRLTPPNDEAEQTLRDVSATLKHKYGCDCPMCLAAYGNPIEDGDDDGPGPF